MKMGPRLGELIAFGLLVRIANCIDCETVSRSTTTLTSQSSSTIRLMVFDAGSYTGILCDL